AGVDARTTAGPNRLRKNSTVTDVLKGHGFIRADNAYRNARASAPEGWFSGIPPSLTSFSAAWGDRRYRFSRDRRYKSLFSGEQHFDGFLVAHSHRQRRVIGLHLRGVEHPVLENHPPAHLHLEAHRPPLIDVLVRAHVRLLDYDPPALVQPAEY